MQLLRILPNGAIKHIHRCHIVTIYMHDYTSDSTDDHMIHIHPQNLPHPCKLVMAFWRRGDITQTFRNNQQLQQFVLTGVTPNGRVLGTGSYGSVEEVSQATCMHSQSIEFFTTSGHLQTPHLCCKEAA